MATEQQERLEGEGEKNTDFAEKPSSNSFFFLSLQSPVCLLYLLLSRCGIGAVTVCQLTSVFPAFVGSGINDCIASWTASKLVTQLCSSPSKEEVAENEIHLQRCLPFWKETNTVCILEVKRCILCGTSELLLFKKHIRRNVILFGKNWFLCSESHIILRAFRHHWSYPFIWTMW